MVEFCAQINKWAAPGPSTTSQVRSLRKVNNNDQVAIAIDMEPGSASGRLEDEDDEKGNPILKRLFPSSLLFLAVRIIDRAHYFCILLCSFLVHGFKSLTTSRIVPRCTRPVTDMIDGLW